MEVYFRWDGGPAPDRKSADWVLLMTKDGSSFAAYTNWDGGVSVLINHSYALMAALLPVNDNTLLDVLKMTWPSILDINTLAELLLAHEYRDALQFLRQRPFKPSSLYNKPEELRFEIRAVKREREVEVIRPQPIEGLKYARPGDPIITTRMVRREVGPMWVGPEALAPVYAKVPHGELHGCVVYDAWGRPVDLKPIAETEVFPRSYWFKLPRVEIREGELPGAGWVICWTWADPKLRVEFFTYANFREYGAVSLVEGSVATTVYNDRKKDIVLFKPAWIPNFNATLADMLAKGVSREETA